MQRLYRFSLFRSKAQKLSFLDSKTLTPLGYTAESENGEFHAIRTWLEMGCGANARAAVGGSVCVRLYERRPLYFCKLLADHFAIHSTARFYCTRVWRLLLSCSSWSRFLARTFGRAHTLWYLATG